MTVAVIEPLKVSDPFGFARKKQGSKKAHELSNYTVEQWDNILKMSTGTLVIRDHGGGCCGAKHLYSFPVYDIMWELELIKRLAKFRVNKPGQVIEAILVNTQYGPNYEWVKCLFKLGFKLVAANRNSNSSNDNFVFLWSTAPLNESTNPTFKAIRAIEKEMITNVEKPSASK